MEADDLDELERRILIAAYRFEFGRFLQLPFPQYAPGEPPKPLTELRGWQAAIPSVPFCMLYVASCVPDTVDGASFRAAIKRLKALALLQTADSPINHDDVLPVHGTREYLIPAKLFEDWRKEPTQRPNADTLNTEQEPFCACSLWRLAETNPLFIRTCVALKEGDWDLDGDFLVAELLDGEGHVITSHQDDLWGPHCVLSRPEGVRVARTLAEAASRNGAAAGQLQQKERTLTDTTSRAQLQPEGGDNAANATMYLVRWWSDWQTGEECTQPIMGLDDLNKEERGLLESTLYEDFGSSELLEVWVLEDLKPPERLRLRKELAENEEWMKMAGGKELARIRASALKYVALIKADRSPPADGQSPDAAREWKSDGERERGQVELSEDRGEQLGLRVDEGRNQVCWQSTPLKINSGADFRVACVLARTDENLADYKALQNAVKPGSVADTVESVSNSPQIKDAVGHINRALKQVGAPFRYKAVMRKGYILRPVSKR